MLLRLRCCLLALAFASVLLMSRTCAACEHLYKLLYSSIRTGSLYS